MTTRRHSLNVLGVAFLAVVGMFSAGSSAKACAEVAKPKACCATTRSADCCCGGSSESDGAGSETIRFGGIDVPGTGGSCECRSSVPDAPSPRPASNSSAQSRTDRGHHEVIAYLGHAPRPIPTGWRLVSGNESLTNVPRYLRTLHLLV